MTTCPLTGQLVHFFRKDTQEIKPGLFLVEKGFDPSKDAFHDYPIVDNIGQNSPKLPPLPVEPAPEPEVVEPEAVDPDLFVVLDGKDADEEVKVEEAAINALEEDADLLKDLEAKLAPKLEDDEPAIAEPDPVDVFNDPLFRRSGPQY